jgi:3',5'-nucleoside bisphosphate phosphatase
MPSRVDLHTHTTASDGTMAPAELFDKAVELGVQVLAISDHDTTAGYEAVQASPALLNPAPPIRLIPAIEINAEGEYACHLLGYWINPAHAPFQNRLAQLREQRIARLRAMADRLSQMGVSIDFENTLKRAGGAVGRPHLADALIQKGVVKSRQEAFDRFLKKGGPAYVPTESPTIEESIELIRLAGGVAVLAHPSYYTSETLLRALVERGIQGIEAYYPEHSRSLTQNYLLWAKTYGLIVTGGSDFHGPKTGRSALACVDVPMDVVDSLERLKNAI